MLLPEHDEHFDNPETYQLKQYRTGVKHTRQQRTAIDVGAHVGIFTKRYARDFDQVIAIEPVNTGCLTHNTRDLNNVHIIPAAVSDRSNQRVYLHNPNIKNSGAWEITDAITNTYVETITVDELQLTDVDLIKIDTQGVEKQVLMGAKNTIHEYKPVIHIETRSMTFVKWIEKTFDYKLIATVNKDRILVYKGV